MDLRNYHEFQQAKRSLKETSMDDSQKKTNGKVYYLSEDERMVVDFDQVKTNYLNRLILSEEYAASVDALFQEKQEDIFFVEFKNGEFDNAEIAKKAKDSLLIFSDITKTNLSYLREEANFVLVINNEKEEKLSWQAKLAVAKANRGNIDFTMYGLNRLRTYCFKTVRLLSASQFEKKMQGISLEQ